MNPLISAIDASVLAQIAQPASRLGHTPDQTRIMREFALFLPTMLETFDVNTPLRIAHCLAQLAHESDSFKTTTEYASGAAYEWRDDLGNSRQGDGKRFKGRGLIQLTGRANYREFTRWLRAMSPEYPDFEAQPELAAQFPWASWSAFWFWNARKLNALADRDDLVGVTRKINGGRNGLEDRAANLKRAKAALAGVAGGLVGVKQGVSPLRRGHRGVAVERLQRGLAKAGFYHLSIDAEFGPATEQAVLAFQKSRGMAADGIAGRDTLNALTPFIAEAS